MNSQRKFIAAVAALCALSASAMTYTEFKEAIVAAPDGGTVVLENDVEVDSALPAITKRITITSPEGTTNTLLRASAYTGILLDMNDTSADITLSNITIDGNKSAGSTGRAISMTAGRLTLGAGAAIRNFNFGYNNGGIHVSLNGSIVMNGGAEISGCDYGYGAHFGMILVGDRAQQLEQGVPDGVFEMNGGIITGNAGHSSQTAPDYDGVLYIYSHEQKNGVIRLNSGIITGNTSENACAGVCPAVGRMYLGGDVCITGNVGGVANDIYRLRGLIYIQDGFCGCATIHLAERERPSKLEATAGGISRMEEGRYFIGAGNISWQEDPEWVLCGYYYLLTSYLYWDKRVITVDGHPCAEYNEAMALVQNGSVLQLDQDNGRIEGIETDFMFTVGAGTNLTVCGAPGAGRRIVRKQNYAAFILEEGASLRLEHILIDGKGSGEDAVDRRLFDTDCANTSLTLGPGAIVSNCFCRSGPCVLNMVLDGQTFMMEEGAMITDSRSTQPNGYGALMRIGKLATYTTPPRFEMCGGLITNCTSAATSAASSGYGGMIYVQEGVFEMTGGKIAGNVCEGSCAGVQHYRGTVRISGSARIENNEGAAPDLYRSGGTLSMFGDFRGHVGISSGAQASGEDTLISIESGATGAWGFFPAANGSDTALVGTPNANGTKVAWTAATGWIDGVGLASAADAATAWGEMTLTLDARSLAEFPHTFKGTALGVNSTVTLVFDPEAFQSYPQLPLRIVSAEDGAFTGEWSFNLPQPRRGRWYVLPCSNVAGRIGYDLRFSPPGARVIIR